MSLFRALCVSGLVAAAAPALAQGGGQGGIDCTKARAPLDRAICGSPALLAQDGAMAAAFSQAVARSPNSAAALKQSQIQWLRDRAASCGNGATPAATEACLLQSGAARLAMLAPAPVAVVAPQAAGPASPPPAQPVARLSEPLAAPPPPAVAIAAAEASLDDQKLPAAEQMATLLHVTHPGRFAIAAKSPTGTAIQLVDMLTGPTDVAGVAGQSDGRLDLLLDVGTYKLRAFGAAQASGDVGFSVAPFRDAGPAQGAPLRGRVDQELGDLQQRGFWLTVAPDMPLRIEAAGRALGDLRLFRDGRELAALTATRRTVEPVGGHPLNSFLLQGNVEPGTYLVVAYGGRAQPWADGAVGQPFHLRTGTSPALAAGWVAGRIGPFGSEVFSAGPATGALRLDLPEVAAASLSATSGKNFFSVDIDRRQREPTARLSVQADGGAPSLVELRGAEGQSYQLRALSGAATRSSVRDGSYWMSIDGAGFGGDEPPLAYVLTQRRGDARPAVLASAAPRVGPGVAWRRRFNLRGQVGLVFEVTAPGPVAVRAEGVAVQAAVAAFGAQLQPRADGTTPSSWDLAAGFYVLQVSPARGAAGILDLTIGPPGVAGVMPATASAADPAVPVGLVTLDGNGRLDLFASRAPGATLVLLERPAPVSLPDGPLEVTLAAGAGIDVPVRMPADGALLATEAGRGPVAAGFDPVPGPTAGRIGTVHVPPADHERSVSLSWQAPAPNLAPIPPPSPPADLRQLAGGGSVFLDLERDSSSSFSLAVAEGGLYRVETLGRLHTTGSIGSAYVPALDHADGNGIGQNMLMQRFLRAGQYRVSVGATDSAGHLGVAARPATLASGATLVPGGSVRAAMPADGGVAFPLKIGERGTYHLDLQSLAAGLTTRLEDSQGWPMLAAGDLSSLDQDLRPGSYRLLVQPAGVAARVVARLARVEKPPVRSGHGPFPLAFELPQKYQWREPPGRDDARIPDSWTFALAGPAAVKLAIGDGMEADLFAADKPEPVARLTHATPFAGSLVAGSYRIAATSLGRNDRLDYTIDLSSTELQADRARSVTVPSTVKFAVAEDRVVSLTSFGPVPLRAVLSGGDGHVVGRYGDRGDDWNIGISRLLPAGSYSLALAAATPPDAVDVPARDPTRDTSQADTASPAADEESGDMSADKGDESAAPSTEARSDANGDAKGGDASSTDTASAAPDAAPDDKQVKTEIRMSLPAPRAPVAVPGDGRVALEGGGVHRLTLAAVPEGGLGLAAASSTAELALALEQQEVSGAWRIVTIAQGTAPMVGVLGDAGGVARRVSVWTIDGGAEPIFFAARVLAAAAQPVGSVTPAEVALGDMPQKIAAALVSDPGAGPVAVAGAGLLAVSAPGQALAPVEGGLVLPQGERFWLVAPGAAPLALTSVRAEPGRELALALPEAGGALLPGGAVADGHIRVWRAASGLGQPGLDAGRGMGVAAGSALALAGDGVARVFNAGGIEPLRLRVAALDLKEQAARVLDGRMAEALAPMSSLAVRLPEGNHSVAFDLAPGTAAIADWRGAQAVTVWAGDVAVSRSVEGGFVDVLLVNTTDRPAPVGVGWTKLPAAPVALVPGMALKRFYGAAGSLDVAVSGDGRLLVAGGRARLIGPGGRVSEGRSLALAGAGRVVIDHGPGLLAAWIEGGVSPWPEPAVQQVSLPAGLAMHDMAMSLGFSVAGPVLLHARSTAPVILALGDGAPVLFPAGAEFHRVVAAGAGRLRVISPHDGPLSGTVELSADPIMPVGEGVGAELAVAPGGGVAFGFAVVRKGPVGVGVRAEPDRLSVRLLGEDGSLVGEGVAQLHDLAVGRYVLEAQVPDDSGTVRVRPAVVGIAVRPSGPPPDVVNMYLALVGRAPN